jgi:hypothetical protein
MKIRTKRIRDAKIGEIISVPLGMILPNAIFVESLFCVLNPEQRCARGTIVEAKGHSKINVGRVVSVNIGCP